MSTSLPKSETTNPTARRAFGLLGASLMVGAVSSPALASGAADMGPMPGMGGRGGMAPGPMMDDPVMRERMLERRISHMLDAVEATPEQRSRIMGIAKSTFAAVAPLRAQQKASRDKGRALMFAATLDRNALEQLRQEQMKLRDAQSQRRLAGMLDVMSALTPEQRAKLAARRPMMGGRSGMGR